MNHLTHGQQFALGIAAVNTMRHTRDAARAVEKLAKERRQYDAGLKILVKVRKEADRKEKEKEKEKAEAEDVLKKRDERLNERKEVNLTAIHLEKQQVVNRKDKEKAKEQRERKKEEDRKEKEKAKEQRERKKEEDRKEKEKAKKQREKAKERKEKEAEAKRARKEKKKKKEDENKKAEKPETKAFAYFFTYFALKGRDELTEEEKEKLSLQVNRATQVEEQYIWELLLRSALMQRLEEDEKKEDGKANQIKLLVEKISKGLHVKNWLLKLEGVLADGGGANAEQEEWINSIQEHFKISNEVMAEAREKREKDLFHKYLERGDDAKQFLYLYSQVVLLDGDGCTEIEREKIIELVLKRINATDLPISLGGKMTAAMAQKGLNSALIACKVDKMAETTQNAVKKSVTEKCFEFKYGEHIISDLEELATVDGAISAEQSEFLSFVNEQLVEAKEFGQKARLQALFYLFVAIGFSESGDICDEESAKIDDLLSEWAENLDKVALHELIKKCKLIRKGFTQEENDKEISRCLDFLRDNLDQKKQTKIAFLLMELAGDKQEESLQRRLYEHLEISGEAMASFEAANLYLNSVELKALLYLYTQVVLLDGDGCTELERGEIIKLLLERSKRTRTHEQTGMVMTEAMAQKGLEEALAAYQADEMTTAVQEQVEESVSATGFEDCFGEFIISDLEDLGTIDGAISAEQSEFLSFVNGQLSEAKEFGEKARLQAVAYLLMVLGFWDLDGITDEESAKIGELLLQWDDSLNEGTLPELIKKCELSYEKDTREQNTEEVVRSIVFLREKLSEAEKTQLSHHMHELAAVDGSIAEQQQGFIQWAWEEMTA